MKNIIDLEKTWIELQKKYNITFEIKEKPYPKSIKPWSEIVDSMWIFIHRKNRLFSSWRLDAECNNNIFELHIKNLESNLKEKIYWIKIENNNDFLF